MLKRSIDLFFSLLLILVLSPFFLMFFILGKFFFGQIFFIQLRPGINGRVFSIYKFCSMSNELDEKGELLPDNKRLSGYGRFLRSLSIDELPSLINVVKGDMSLVGPRPLLVEYLPLYNEQQKRRHEVKPGITGWAQVNGRNALSWEEKFALDIWYVENQSFYVDLKIIFLTIYKVLKKSDISHGGEATMHKFIGSTSKKKGDTE